MVDKDPSKRAKISDIKKSSWYNQEIYSANEYSDIMRKMIKNMKTKV